MESRNKQARDKDATIAQQAAPRTKRPPPCPLTSARLPEAMARDDFMDLTLDSSDEAVFDTPPPIPNTEHARGENRPAPLHRESAPIVGNPPPVEPPVVTMRSRSDPAGNIPTEKERRAKVRRERMEKMTVQRTDKEMTRMIKTPVSGAGKLHTMGWTYVMQVEIHGRKFVKIGYSKDGSHKRADTISSKCRETVQVKNVDDSGEIRYCERAEALAKLELRMAKYEFACTCDGRPWHTEYFDVDYDTAVRVVGRWSTFCSLNPYNFAGHLSKNWSNRLQRKYVLRPAIVEPRNVDTLMVTWDDFVYVSVTRAVLDDVQVAIENWNDYCSPICGMLFTLTLLQRRPDSTIRFWLHAICILWFSMRTMTDNNFLFGHVFRKVFDVSLPWKERQLLSKGVESRVLPERSQQDHSEHDNGGTVEIDLLVPLRVPGSFEAGLTV